MPTLYIRKFLFSVLLFFLAGAVFFLANFFTKTAYAQGGGNAQLAAPNLNDDVPRNQHTFVQSMFIETIASIYCLVTGTDPIDSEHGCLTLDPQTKKLGYAPKMDNNQRLGGLMGVFPGMFAAVYTPPTSSVGYARYMASKFGIVESALAQPAAGGQQNPQTGQNQVPVVQQPGQLPIAAGGVVNNVSGFDALQPLQAIWTSSRNITYLLFVIIFILIGIGIMLRVKIDPRTVMTVQNQIPRIIVCILLITFSYAISALMIDGMWLATYTGVNILTDSQAIKDSSCGKSLQGRVTLQLFNLPFNLANDILRLNCDDIENITPKQIAEQPKQRVELGYWDYFMANVRCGWAEFECTQADLAKYETDELRLTVFTRLSELRKKEREGNLKDEKEIQEKKDLEAQSQELGGIVNAKGGIWDMTHYTTGAFELTINNIITSMVYGTRVEPAECSLKTLKDPGRSIIEECSIAFFSWLAGVLLFLIIYLVIMFALFRVWFMLLKAYVLIIIYIITAPFWIIMGLLPGKPLGFEKWLRRMFANLAVFPATVLLLTLASILSIAFNAPGTNNTFVPPLIGNTNINGFGSLLAFAVILVLPGLLDVLRSSLHAVGRQGGMMALTMANSMASGAAPVKGFGQGLRKRLFEYDPYNNHAGIGFRILGGGDIKSNRYKLVSWLTNTRYLGKGDAEGPASPRKPVIGH